MERNPLGALTERVSDATTRTPSTFSFLRWQTATLALLLTMCSGPALFAQDEPPEQALKSALAEQSLLLDATKAGNALVAVGHRGHILVSEDSGTTWVQSEVPTRSTLTGVHFHDRNLGWAVGHDSVILRTTDGGTTWERVNWAPDDESPFLEVWFSDAENGVVIGSYGSYFVTTDGGRTWTFEPLSEDDFHLNQIAKSDGDRLYIAAEAGFAYRSDDGGSSWTEMASPYEGSFFGVLPLDGDALLLYGLRGHLFRSEDAGETWAELETGTVAILNDGLRLDDGRIVIVGLGGVILVSDDDGKTFELRQQSSRSGIQAVVDEGNGQLLLVGEFGARMLPVSELFGG